MINYLITYCILVTPQVPIPAIVKPRADTPKSGGTRPLTILPSSSGATTTPTPIRPASAASTTAGSTPRPAVKNIPHTIFLVNI